MDIGTVLLVIAFAFSTAVALSALAWIFIILGIKGAVRKQSAAWVGADERDTKLMATVMNLPLAGAITGAIFGATAAVLSGYWLFL